MYNIHLYTFVSQYSNTCSQLFFSHLRVGIFGMMKLICWSQPYPKKTMAAIVVNCMPKNNAFFGVLSGVLFFSKKASNYIKLRYAKVNSYESILSVFERKPPTSQRLFFLKQKPEAWFLPCFAVSHHYLKRVSTLKNWGWNPESPRVETGHLATNRLRVDFVFTWSKELSPPPIDHAYLPYHPHKPSTQRGVNT